MRQGIASRNDEAKVKGSMDLEGLKWSIQMLVILLELTFAKAGKFWSLGPLLFPNEKLKLSLGDVSAKSHVDCGGAAICAVAVQNGSHGEW